MKLFYLSENRISYQMNFFKNTWTKVFGTKEKEEQDKNSKLTTEEDNIPEEIVLQLFELSSKFIKETKEMMSDETKLKLYSYYKQGTEGNCQTAKPAFYDVVGKKKWDEWSSLKGVEKFQAMKFYIVLACGIDSTIYKKIQDHILGDEEEKAKSYNIEKQKKSNNGGKGFQKVEVIDYSDEYSHPYFKPIAKGEDIAQISHELLLQKNDSPNVYPLHFVIDRERQDLVQKFLKELSKEQIEQMKDEEETGILEYAQLMENEEILKMIKQKLI